MTAIDPAVPRVDPPPSDRRVILRDPASRDPRRRLGGRVHARAPDTPGRTLCGWAIGPADADLAPDEPVTCRACAFLLAGGSVHDRARDAGWLAT